MALKLTESKQDPKPEKKKTEKIEASNLSDVLAAVKKSKGDGIVVKGNLVATPRRLPTGVFEFDFYIGGGFPRGRYSIVYGPESSLKTNIALRAAATAQTLPAPCNKVVWVNVEQSFDPIWAQKMGVKVEDLIVVEPGYGEEAVDLVDAVVRADDVALVVVDSVAALIANKEVGQSTENYDIGTSALLIKRMCNKLMVAFAEQKRKGLDPCVILINQTRYKPGVMFGDPETMPGGEAQKFLSSLRVRFRGTNVVDKATSTILKKAVHVIVKKAKIPVRAVDFDFEMVMEPHDGLQIGDTDSFNNVKAHLQALDLLTKHPSGYQVNKKGPFYPTLTAMEAKYNKDTTFRNQMQALVIEQHKDQPMVFVEEVAKGPKEEDIPPGVVQPIAAEK